MERRDNREQSAAGGNSPLAVISSRLGIKPRTTLRGLGSGSGPACVPTLKPRMTSAPWSISGHLFMADIVTLKQGSRGVTNEIKSGSITPARREPAGSGQKLNPVTFNPVSHTCDRR